jgi:uncharacterized membrane protein
MKIDCPHCGVHGSVDDSLVRRKLCCPKCSKVFIITEDILPEVDDIAMVHQEILYDDEPQSLLTAEQETVEAEESVELAEAAELAEEEIGEESEEIEEILADDDSTVEQCSVCNQSFASEFLVEVESELYCALCQPDSEEEGLELLDEEDSEEVPLDELLEIMEEDSSDEEAEDILAEEEDEVLDLMGDESEDDSAEADSNVLALMADEDEDDAEEESVELEICSGCGESLHPDFLETVGSKRYCALCVPEEVEDEEGIETEETEEVDYAQDEEQAKDETDSTAQALMGDGEDEDGYPKEPCSVCGEKFHRDFMQEVDSKLYCGICQPEVIEVLTGDEMAVATGTEAAAGETDEEDFGSGPDFTVGELIKEAWQRTKGAKASIWGAMILLYLIFFAISFGGTAAFEEFYKGSDPTISMGVNGALQLVSSWLSMLMTGGVMLIGVRQALEQRVSWKMVFAGFSRSLSITIAIVLQTVLVIIGFVLLILPGIYLSVGYALTLPLILDKGMGPWEALEASRKAIHEKWWTVFGLYLVMMLLYIVSAIPLGLGLIWTVPMFFVLIGVLYVRLFGADGSVEEEVGEIEEEIEEETEEETEEEIEEEIEETEDETEEEQEEASEETEQVK